MPRPQVFSSYMCGFHRHLWGPRSQARYSGSLGSPHKGLDTGPLYATSTVSWLVGPAAFSSSCVDQLHFPTSTNGLVLPLGVLKEVLTVAAVEVVLAPGTVR